MTPLRTVLPASLLLTATLFTSCGTDPEDDADTGDTGIADGGHDTSPDADVDATEVDTTGDTGVDCGPMPSVACLTLGCPESEECVYTESTCYPSGCTCNAASGTWICEDADCQYGYACMPDDGCDGPNPSVTCLQTGCDEGFACSPTTEATCVPSSCVCGDDGSWVCTEDCGAPYYCAPVADACPDAPPIGDDCDDEGQRCEWGTECCCGQCYPSTVCTCGGGSWGCYATDACMIPGCEGQPCTTDDDCVGGPATDLTCVDGVCADGDSRSRCGGFDAQTCETISSAHCEWVETPGCAAEVGPAILGASGCFPYGDCAGDDDCPTGYFCEVEIQVSPRCAWEDPLCDACREVRSLCVPRGV